jgi:hypothetical protein
MKKEYRIIISGGGTGGHIFPALSIADAIRSKHPEAKILFVGANNRMEMQRVPDAGYDIVGLPIAGFNRKNLFKNIKVLWLILKSQRMAKKIIKEFAPQVAVGVGGYASGPTLKMAASMNIPTLIQEQNSYAGVTNKILSKKAKMICVAYENMDRFFPHEKIKLTGNPVRKNLLEMRANRNEAIKAMGLDENMTYHLRSIPQEVRLQDFGTLVNMLSPVRLKPGTALYAVADKAVKFHEREVDLTGSGSFFCAAGFEPTPCFSGSGFADGVAAMKDWDSRLYHWKRAE